jgi:hypothetical protein
MPARSDRLDQMLPERAAVYYTSWLTAEGRSHDGAAIVAFIAAHPSMFGRSLGVVVRGYQRSLLQRGVSDEAGAFGDYIAWRYERWRSARRAERAQVGPAPRADSTAPSTRGTTAIQKSDKTRDPAGDSHGP